MSVDIYDPDRRPDGRTAKPVPIGQLVGTTTAELLARAKPTAAATVAWHQAVTSRESAHTMAVHLAEPDDPNNRKHVRVITVYVDSNAILQDFRTNANLYLMKLERVGLRVDEIAFRLSRKAGASRETST